MFKKLYKYIITFILIFAICVFHSMRQGFVKASSAILSIVLTIVLMFAFQDNIHLQVELCFVHLHRNVPHSLQYRS